MGEAEAEMGEPAAAKAIVIITSLALADVQFAHNVAAGLGAGLGYVRAVSQARPLDATGSDLDLPVSEDLKRDSGSFVTYRSPECFVALKEGKQLVGSFSHGGLEAAFEITNIQKACSAGGTAVLVATLEAIDELRGVFNTMHVIIVSRKEWTGDEILLPFVDRAQARDTYEKLRAYLSCRSGISAVKNVDSGDAGAADALRCLIAEFAESADDSAAVPEGDDVKRHCVSLLQGGDALMSAREERFYSREVINLCYWQFFNGLKNCLAFLCRMPSRLGELMALVAELNEVLRELKGIVPIVRGGSHLSAMIGGEYWDRVKVLLQKYKSSVAELCEELEATQRTFEMAEARNLREAVLNVVAGVARERSMKAIQEKLSLMRESEMCEFQGEAERSARWLVFHDKYHHDDGCDVCSCPWIPASVTAGVKDFSKLIGGLMEPMRDVAEKFDRFRGNFLMSQEARGSDPSALDDAVSALPSAVIPEFGVRFVPQSLEKLGSALEGWSVRVEGRHFKVRPFSRCSRTAGAVKISVLMCACGESAQKDPGLQSALGDLCDLLGLMETRDGQQPLVYVPDKEDAALVSNEEVKVASAKSGAEIAAAASAQDAASAQSLRIMRDHGNKEGLAYQDARPVITRKSIKKTFESVRGRVPTAPHVEVVLTCHANDMYRQMAEEMPPQFGAIISSSSIVWTGAPHLRVTGGDVRFTTSEEGWLLQATCLTNPGMTMRELGGRAGMRVICGSAVAGLRLDEVIPLKSMGGELVVSTRFDVSIGPLHGWLIVKDDGSKVTEDDVERVRHQCVSKRRRDVFSTQSIPPARVASASDAEAEAARERAKYIADLSGRYVFLAVAERLRVDPVAVEAMEWGEVRGWPPEAPGTFALLQELRISGRRDVNAFVNLTGVKTDVEIVSTLCDLLPACFNTERDRLRDLPSVLAV
jgi:hypothetical protein